MHSGGTCIPLSDEVVDEVDERVRSRMKVRRSVTNKGHHEGRVFPHHDREPLAVHVEAAVVCAGLEHVAALV